MTTESFMDQIKAFGARLGLPKVDVDKLVDIQLKNIDALGRSAQAAGEGAKALADKQREIMEAAFKETSAMVRDFHPVGDPQGTLAKQKDYAKRAFELTMQNTRDVAESDQEDDDRRDDDRPRQIARKLNRAARQRGSRRERREEGLTLGPLAPREAEARLAPRTTSRPHFRAQSSQQARGKQSSTIRRHRRRTRWTTRWPIGLAQKKERTSLPP